MAPPLRCRANITIRVGEPVIVSQVIATVCLGSTHIMLLPSSFANAGMQSITANVIQGDVVWSSVQCVVNVVSPPSFNLVVLVPILMSVAVATSFVVWMVLLRQTH